MTHPSLPQLETAEPDWLAERRRHSRALASELDLPRFKGAAGWEFTDLGKLDLAAFTPADGGDPDAADRAERLFGDVEGDARLVQVDGRVATGPGDVIEAEDLPGTGEVPADEASAEAVEPPAGDAPIVMPLALAAAHHPELVRRHLGTIVDGEADLFAARNEAEWTGGAFVYVPRNLRVEEPIVVTVVQDAPGTALHWRTLVVVEEGAEAEVWEEYLSADAKAETLLNTSVELSVGQNASLRYVCGQNLSERSWIFGSQRAEVARDGALDWVALGFGSARGRVRMETKLAGPGADAKVTGAYATHGRQHVDFDTLQEHAAPNTTSDLAFRGVLQDRSSAVWRGMIQVDPGAQQTDAFQESRNLLLSKRAHADAIPGLEIQANDVRCTHAAAIAQIDPEQLFYLESRGLRNETAKHLVIEGFLEALVERFEAGPVREVLSGALERRLEAVLG